MDRIRIMKEVERELERAREKFPFWPRDMIHAAAIVVEEAGELLQSSLQFHFEEKKTLEDCDKEAIHTLAMCIRFLEGK